MMYQKLLFEDHIRNLGIWRFQTAIFAFVFIGILHDRKGDLEIVKKVQKILKF